MRWGCAKVEEAGFTGQRGAFKADQEEAIVAYKKAVAARRQGETPLIESPVRESKSNGAMENAIRRWAGQLRTLKHCLEARLSRGGEPEEFQKNIPSWNG